MTIAKTGSSASYAGNGVTVAFSFPFRFFDDTDLKVYIVAADGTSTLQTLTTDYSISNAGDETGGTVTMVTAPASTETLLIEREVPETQSVDYQNNDAFPAETHEQALDRLTLLVQQQSRGDGLHLTFPTGDTNSPVLPVSSARADKLLGFGAGGALQTYDTTVGVIAGRFETISELKGSTDSFDASTFVEIKFGNAKCQAVASGAEFTNAGGQGFVVTTGPIYEKRAATEATDFALYPDGTIGEMAGLKYEVLSTATAGGSATSDLSVNGLIPHGLVYVEHFGAVGYKLQADALTGVDSGPAIQRGVDYLAELTNTNLSGGTLHFPDLVYGIGTTVALDSTKLAIAWRGTNKSVRCVLRTQLDIPILTASSGTWGFSAHDIVFTGFNGGASDVVSITNVFLFTFKNVFFEKNTIGLDIANSNDITIENCNFESPRGINVSGTSKSISVSSGVFLCEQYAIRSSSTEDGVTVTGGIFRQSTPTDHMVLATGTGSISLTGCMFDVGGTSYAAVQIENGSGTTVTGCRFIGCHRGVFITTGAENANVTGCFFKDINDVAIGYSASFAGNGNVASSCTFDNCTLNTTAPDNVQFFFITNDAPLINSPTIDDMIVQQDGSTIGGITTNGITLSDDAAASRSLGSSRGFALISSNAAVYALVFLNFDTIVDISSSATFDVNTSNGTLTGTTGTDGNATIRMNNGTFYIENRLGSERYFNVLLLSNINQ